MPKIKHSDPEIHKPSTKDVLHSLESEYQWLDHLKKKNKPYDLLINVVQREGKNGEDGDYQTLTIKMIADEINETSAKVTKWLNQMYSDLWELNDTNPKLFKTNGQRYHMHFQNTSTNQAAYFNLWLNKLLNCNEGFNWPFIYALLGTYYFYISEITHEHVSGKLQTIVYLKSGFHNSYRDTLLDKALFMRLLDLSDIFHLNSYELDKVLREKVEPGLVTYIEQPKKNRRSFND